MEPQNPAGPSSLDDTIRLEESVRFEGYPDNSVGPASLERRQLPPADDFAHIIPANDRAKQAFHEIVQIQDTDPNWNSHCQRFIYVSEFKEKVNLRDSQASDGSEYDDEPQEIYSGYFRLNLTILPEKFPQGWIIGAGRPKMDHLGVDLLVTIKGRSDNVRGRHASIRHHPETRLPMLVPAAGKRVLLNGEEVFEGTSIFGRRTGLTLGNLAFVIEFLPQDEHAYIDRLDEVARQSGNWFKEKIESIDPTPSDNHLVLQGYLIQTPQAFGAFGVVCPCVQISSGDVYAVKRVQRTRSSFAQVGDEVEALKLLGRHVSSPHVSTNYC